MNDLNWGVQKKLSKERLDLLLVKRNFCESRSLAQKLIRAGKVKVKKQIIDKPGTEIEETALIEIKAPPKFVSRGGKKLAQALQVFPITVKDRVCLDGGISTGGFTDCLLQAGAKRVYGVDVGYGQVAWKLRQDPRIVLRERTNFRYLTCAELYGDRTPADLGVMDLSFISLIKVLPTLWELLVPPREVILLIKPQFEVGREKVGKKGVVRDPQEQALAIYQVLGTAFEIGWRYRGLTWSPLTGPAGNIEYLLWLNITRGGEAPDLANLESITQKAMTFFS